MSHGAGQNGVKTQPLVGNTKNLISVEILNSGMLSQFWRPDSCLGRLTLRRIFIFYFIFFIFSFLSFISYLLFRHHSRHPMGKFGGQVWAEENTWYENQG
jgi:hypothetical protein